MTSPKPPKPKRSSREAHVTLTWDGRLVEPSQAAGLREQLEAGQVQTLHVTFRPLLCGGETASTLTGLPGDFLPETVRCELESLEVTGEEARARYRVL